MTPVSILRPKWLPYWLGAMGLITVGMFVLGAVTIGSGSALRRHADPEPWSPCVWSVTSGTAALLP
ncbi:hypothetical protein GCM10019016_126230 [Streptomyces prasinosporus]|uniref:Uncharacterized protein n=1 Tax=Streptomyces prasinosporus TaxID=68256 RepID=A0ABP6UCT5_9ACTN|nr:hypothetical protein GCM10010332_00810 [Streptomyces albogriseolus]